MEFRVRDFGFGFWSSGVQGLGSGGAEPMAVLQRRQFRFMGKMENKELGIRDLEV